jgi:uncharacterized membrane protein
LFLGLSLFFGLLVRIFPGLQAGFPLNDGGMFLVMIGDLRDNGFALPAFTTYNLSGIPYVYPPLGFYMAGLLNLVGISGIDLLRWLPPVINCLAIGGFFLMASEIVGSRSRAAVAAVFFALIPGSFLWQIMGGGLTRSLGLAFLSLSVLVVHRCSVRTNGNTALSILFCSRPRQSSGGQSGRRLAACCCCSSLD